MPSDVTRDEFKHLTARVDVVDRGIPCKKGVMRDILEETLRQGDMIASLRAEMNGMCSDVNAMGDRLATRIDRLGLGLEAKVDRLAISIPKVVRTEMRKVLREHGL